MANNKKKPTKKQAQEIDVVEAVSKTEEFFEKYKKTLIYSIFAIIAIAAIILLINTFYVVPQKKEAVAQTFPAEQYFRVDSFALALNGDGNALGFKDIIKDYGTKGGKAVYFYAGVCELKLGHYKEAISYLKKYEGKDPIIKARALACIGDSYAAMNDFSSAASYYEKAAGAADNIFAASYLLKSGIMYEALKKPAKALDAYKEIKEQYPLSKEGNEIDKYITRIERQ
ncbi:MAG: tetratricopeptide repeat protein [Bacteroidales bacterium]|nr:tetratricopeptide repeat protein [Bacteroidales bacterium]